MKNLIKISFVLLVAMLVSVSASAQKQEVRKKKEKPAVVIEQADNSPFSFEQADQTQRTGVKKGQKKFIIWDVLPADGFVPTGNKEVDKKNKRAIQKQWAKDNPKEFQALLERHGIKVKKPKS